MAPARTDDLVVDVPAQVTPCAAGARSPAKARWAPVVLAVLVALVWPAMWALGQGSTDSLLGAGDDGPSRAFIEREIPDLAPLVSLGHDGQSFYVIARHPFDPEATGDAIDRPAYRYRRILFPLLARAMAPGGGRPVIYAFLLLSLVGVALGARALQTMGGPRWLPIVAAVNPAAILSLSLSLSDALGAGLAMAAIACATRRRWAWAVAFAVLAGLTRETFLIAALAIAVAPGMPRVWRVASVAAPAAALAAWMAYVAGRVDQSILAASSDQLALPFTGLFGSSTDAQTWFMTLATVALLAYGAWVAPASAPHVRLVLALQVILLVCVSDLVAFNYVNSIRTCAPLLPLAVWAIVARRGGRSEVEVDAATLTPAPT